MFNNKLKENIEELENKNRTTYERLVWVEKDLDRLRNNLATLLDHMGVTFDDTKRMRGLKDGESNADNYLPF